jgi:hypothetical protein
MSERFATQELTEDTTHRRTDIHTRTCAHRDHSRSAYRHSRSLASTCTAPLPRAGPCGQLSRLHGVLETGETQRQTERERVCVCVCVLLPFQKLTSSTLNSVAPASRSIHTRSDERSLVSAQSLSKGT